MDYNALALQLHKQYKGKITDQHKIAAVEVIATLVNQPDAEHIIPAVFDERLVSVIAKVIK